MPKRSTATSTNDVQIETTIQTVSTNDVTTAQKIDNKIDSAAAHTTNAADRAAARTNEVINNAADKAKNIVDTTTTKANDVADHVKATAHNAADKVETTAHNAADHVKTTAHNAADKVETTAHNAADKVRNTTNNAVNKVKATTNDVKESASSFWDNSKFDTNSAHITSDRELIINGWDLTPAVNGVDISTVGAVSFFEFAKAACEETLWTGHSLFYGNTWSEPYNHAKQALTNMAAATVVWNLNESFHNNASDLVKNVVIGIGATYAVLGELAVIGENTDNSDVA
ncbi:MAG: hypothetical protein ACK4OM_04080 [Alphaproteobacteria bacterium]